MQSLGNIDIDGIVLSDILLRGTKMLIRILTENKNYEDVQKLTRQFIPAFTILKAEGCWGGAKEHSLIIEIDTMKNLNEYRERADKLAYAIKKLNNQDAVLIQYIECESRLV